MAEEVTGGAESPRREEGKDMLSGVESQGEDKSFQRRLPSPLTRVSDIQSSDIRVSVIGTVIGRADDGIVLDDGTGKIDVTLEGQTQDLPERVRVFGRVVPVEGGFQLQGEIVQDMSGLDLELLGKVRELEH